MNEASNSNCSLSMIIAGIAVGLGLLGAGYFVSHTLYNSVMIDTSDVKGLAERDVTADSAIWEIAFKVNNADMKKAYAEAEDQATIVRDFLVKSGFKDDEIFAGQTGVNENIYRDDNGVVTSHTYSINRSLIVSTSDVNRVYESNQHIGDLISSGLLLTRTDPRYRFNGLNKIKPEMLREAAQNAREAAEEFAKNAGVKVGAIRSASQGAFEVRDAESGEYGSDDRSVNKRARVVTNVTFYLR